MFIKIKKLDKRATLPVYGTEGAACFDISTIESGIVEAGSSKVFATGLAFEIPSGYVLKVYSRSGHGFNKDIRLANCVGILDSDFRGQLMVKLKADGESLKVEEGDRIAQGMVLKFDKIVFEEVDELSNTERGEGGMGSTGVTKLEIEASAELKKVFLDYYEARFARDLLELKLNAEFTVISVYGGYKIVPYSEDVKAC
jgi:dUTP pyrophosphatase